MDRDKFLKDKFDEMVAAHCEQLYFSHNNGILPIMSNKLNDVRYLKHLLEWATGKDLHTVRDEYEEFKREFPEMCGEASDD